jgi:hypothetical protein
VKRKVRSCTHFIQISKLHNIAGLQETTIRKYRLAHVAAFVFLFCLSLSFPRLFEWPARTIIGGIYLGLPWDHMKDEDVDNVKVLRGVNWLAPTTVQVSAITFTIPDCENQCDFSLLF